nr:hypothetical protein [Tanacetum cinerariifolium]
DRAASEAVGNRAEQAGAEEQPQKGRRRECGLIGETEYALRTGRKETGANQTGADVGGLEQVVQFEEAANGQQRHQLPDRRHGGQTVDAGGDQRGANRVDAISGLLRGIRGAKGLRRGGHYCFPDPWDDAC